MPQTGLAGPRMVQHMTPNFEFVYFALSENVHLLKERHKSERSITNKL